MSAKLQDKDSRLAAIQYEVDELYQKQAYKAAYDLITEAEDRFLDELPEIRYWRACLAACMGEIKLSLELLEWTVAEGGWYSAQQLREEQDLEDLQGVLRFEKLASTCLERQRTAEALSQPAISILEPESIQGGERLQPPLMLALHGNTQTDEHALQAWQPMLKRGYLLAAPRSSQVAWGTTRSWTNLELGVNEVRSHLAQLTERISLDTARSVIGGFSMGAGLALLLVLQGLDFPIRNFILVGPYLPDIDMLTPLFEGLRAAEIRGYIVVGDRDDPCSTIARTLTERLRTHGYSVELEVQPGLVHDFPLDFNAVVERALSLFSSHTSS
jgi:predicted esterase